MREPTKPFVDQPDPGQAKTIDDLAESLRLLKVWAGNPSYEWIKNRINAAWTAAGRPTSELVGKTTVVDCFRSGRRRLNAELVSAIVQALHPDAGYMTQWRQALQVVGGQFQAASQVRVQDRLPEDLPGFVGRAAVLDKLQRGLNRAHRAGGAAVIAVIEGMAGVGKTQLAIHLGHLLSREVSFDQVLFVNLRGFHADPTQPPADPSAVLDGFLRLLGVSGHHIPHDLSARVAAYQDRLAGTSTLVLLDNAVDEDQLRPLLPEVPGCLTLVTSRRSMAGLKSATHLTLDVFTGDEALQILAQVTPGTPPGDDPDAPARIGRRCGHLPLALGLVAGHIRSTSGWTLTDHADRLDERHRRQRLDTGVELALDVSYQHLSPDQQRLLRLAALHPGPDFDAYAAAALTGADLATINTHLDRLYDDHLLQHVGTGRYSLHDLVRAYAAGEASDKEPPRMRRAAMCRLLDYLRHTASLATEAAYSYTPARRSQVPPATTPTPDPLDASRAGAWLDTELANLLAVATHAARDGWPEHTLHLSRILPLHLHARGRYGDLVSLQQHARTAAQVLADRASECDALNGLGWVHWLQGRYQLALRNFHQAIEAALSAKHREGEAEALTGLGWSNQKQAHCEKAAKQFRQAQQISRDTGLRRSEMEALHGLGWVHWFQGRYEQALHQFDTALKIARTIGHRGGEIDALLAAGNTHRMISHLNEAHSHFERALAHSRTIDHSYGEMHALLGLGNIYRVSSRYELASDYFGQALQIACDTGQRQSEMDAHNGLGHVERSQGRYPSAAEHHKYALGLATDADDSHWEIEALYGLGHLHHDTGEHDMALANLCRALDIATELRQPAAQARTHDGIAHTHLALGRTIEARQHWRYVLQILADLCVGHIPGEQTSVETVRARITRLDPAQPSP
ncbi:ATP-binding protein [Micromonospora sp. CPCC 206061]|uniref:ATP-binding protein n=1 Tax=Micromonospora sp. CPCC 206061 TaxID=3122410 RepID=UPI002FF26B5A